MELLDQSHCPPIPLDKHPLLTQEVRLPRGHTKTRHYRPSTGYFEGFEGYNRRVADHIITNRRPSSIACCEFHWSSLVEYCQRIHLNAPQCVWHRYPQFQQVHTELVWKQALCTICYNLPSDLHSVCTLALEIWCSYWPINYSTALQFQVGQTGWYLSEISSSS